ncbi:MAG: DegT/DnrJ/EryC1/StrS family aminotransferase [Proteobacteria bacterium]|nr:DegT/DnrJ/EryC1/StrS family aminotransferase [Pseudomonadota bacterium]
MTINSVPALDLLRQYRELLPQVSRAMSQVVESGAFILGPDVGAFEKEVSEWMGSQFALGVSNGTDALFIALRALGVGQNDQVLSSPFTFFATVSATVNSGATPVFSEIDPNTFNLDANRVEEVLKQDKQRRIKAIIPVHLYGQACDMEAFQSLSKRYGVFLIEDACQSIGAVIKNKKTGNWSEFGCFSLYPTKNLGALGDAGIITTNDQALAEKVLAIRNHGSKIRYVHEIIGSNFRMDTVQAAALRVFLPHLNHWIESRQKIACFYDEQLGDLEQIVVPKKAPYSTHTYHQYTVRVLNGKRDAFKNHLSAQKIGHMVYYPIPCHLQKALSSLGYKKGDFPIAEQACEEVVSLPIFPGMSNEEQEYVVRAIKAFS